MLQLIIPCVLLLLAAPIASAEALPRVLILGDGVYNEPATAAGRALKGQAQVVWKRPGDSGTALLRLGELLGTEKWDLIHFNFGMADLHYKDPSTKAVRVMSKHAGGVRVTTAGQYEKNLNELVKRLQATGAKLIWASTTPITSSKSDNIFDPGSEIEFNAIAVRVMAQHQVPIHDLHAFVLANIKNKKDPNPLSFNGIPLNEALTRSISSSLNLKASVK